MNRLTALTAAVMAITGGVALVGCDKSSLKLGAPMEPAPMVAMVNGSMITERDLTPLIANGLDRVNAIDRAINRSLAADQARAKYGAEVEQAVRQAETEVAANVYATREMAALLKAVTPEDIEQRYATSVKDADFNGYQLYFAFYGTEQEAREGRAKAQAGDAEALKIYQPVAADREGRALFVARNEVPYSLGVFVAKLSEGQYTEPSLVRNGYIVLQARHIKKNEKPSLESVREVLRRSIADERLAKQLADYREKASIQIK